jgi:transposase-like protein
MPRACTICSHSEREEIDRLLVRGDSIAGIARDFAVSEDALKRHFDNHVPKTLAASPSAKEITDADKLLSEIEEVKKHALSLLDKAEEAQDTRVYGPPSQYLKEFREYVRLMAELSGKLAAQPQITIISSPEWVEFRTLIITALDPYPNAKEAVVDAIRRCR